MRQRVWLYPSMEGWHFVKVSKQAAKEIKEYFGQGVRVYSGGGNGGKNELEDVYFSG